MPSAKEYPGTTRNRMDCLRQNLASKGITLLGTDSATIEYQGVRLSVNYDEPKQLLKIDILQRPEFIPESLIWGFIDNSVQQCP
jgi:hypothetical protein